MHRGTDQGKCGPALDPLICRTLRREYRLHVPDEAARRTFGFLQVDPDIVGVDLEIKDVWISRRDGFWALEIAQEILIEGSSQHLISEVYGHIFRDIYQSHPTSPMIHAATLCIGDKRIAIAGGKGFGKTTLILHLVSRGYRIEGDEHIVLEVASVVARPRTLRVKQGSFDVVHGLPEAIFDQPRLALWDGGYVYAVSPRLFGRPWSITRGQLDALVLLEPNHGGRSVLKGLPFGLRFQRLMEHVVLHSAEIPQQLARIHSLATRLPAYALRLGDLEGAEFHLAQIAAT